MNWHSLFKSGIILSMLALFVLPSAVFAAPTMGSKTISCSLAPATGRTIVELASNLSQADFDAKAKLVANQGEVKAQLGPITASIPAGDYKVTIQTFDDHGTFFDQKNEKVLLELYNGATLITKTNATSDLPDNQDTITTEVNASLTIATAVTAIKARQSAYPSTNPESIVPVCVAFDKIEAPVTETLSCPLTAQAGRTVVNFLKTPTVKMLGNNSLAKAKSGPYTTNLPAGAYDITLVSYDDHGPSNNQVQPAERYKLSLYQGNSLVVESNAISDIPDADQYRTEKVNTSFSLPTNITSITAMHDAYPGAATAESVTPICAAFDLVQICEVPDISSNLSIETDESEDFTYTIVSVGNTATYTVSTLPTGLTFDGVNKISGKPTVSGDFQITVGAQNSCGNDSATVNLKINECVPIETLPTLVEKEIKENEYFEYIIPIGATTMYTINADNLPDGLRVVDNMIKGTPTEAGVFEISITAVNGCSDETMVLKLEIEEGEDICLNPDVDVASRKVIDRDAFFSYDVFVDGTSPVTVTVSGLPSGLFWDASDREISGYPTQAGSYVVEIKATNDCGEASDEIELIVENDEQCRAVQPNAPGTQFVQAGDFFSYRITTTGGNYDRLFVSGLPDGMTHTGDTISGTPTIPGTYRIDITAANDCGLNVASFDLVITTIGGVTLESIPDTGPWTDLAKSPALYSLLVFGGATMLMLVPFGFSRRRKLAEQTASVGDDKDELV